MSAKIQQSPASRGSSTSNTTSTPKPSNRQGIGPKTPGQGPTKHSRTTPLRPNRVNTAVNVTPRKVSAPSKLLSVLGGSLEHIPDTVSVRRKASTPARHAASDGTPKKPSVGHRMKKTSAPSQILNQPMSKDHSSGSQTTKSTDLSNTAPPLKTKKTSTALPPDGQQQQLPPVKEKQQKSTKPHKKMSSTAPSLPASNYPPDRGGLMDEMDLNIGKNTKKSSSTNPSTHLTDRGGTLDDTDNIAIPDRLVIPTLEAEKLQLEKRVSDLVKNAECKKQEMAALKMENNRLKDTIREKNQSNNDDAQSKSKASSSPPSSSEANPEIESTKKFEETIGILTSENKALKDHLQHFGLSLDSSLSDQQKGMILSKVSVLSQNGTLDGSGVDRSEWDNKSSSSISEISVACLQDRIQQMEETHYCTNEELQATLQELDDLKDQLDEAHQEVQQLQEEKQVILESLTQQTEKLNEHRAHNDTLKHMLIQQSENSQDLSQCEKTQRLMELLKSVQEDRELLQIKQEELDQQVNTTKEAEERYHHDSQLIRDRMKLLETMVEQANSEKRLVETQLAEATEKAKAAEIENKRIKNSHENAKDKITELEAAVISGEKSELADVLDGVRKEKETLEKETAQLQKKLNSVKCENDRLKDQISSLQDDLMVTRNNAKTHMDDVEWRKTQVEDERRRLKDEMEVLRGKQTDLQITCQLHLEDKRELKASLSETQKKLAETLERLAEHDRSLKDEKNQFKKREEEWDQFKVDLLTTVRVANDFKTEAQHELETLQLENSSLKERLKQLDQDLEKAKASKLSALNTSVSLSSNTSSSTALSERRALRAVSSPLSNGDNPILAADRRNPRPLSRGDSRVKSLIESIESATKQTRAGSRSSSTSSICSTSSESNNNIAPKTPIMYKRNDSDAMIRNTTTCTSPLKETGNNLVSSPSSPLRTLQRNSFTEGLPSFAKTGSNLSDSVKMNQLGEKNAAKLSVQSEPINKPLSILSNKIDLNVRRNSYGQQLSGGDKKDPLAHLAQGGGSKRNALLKWCQNKTLGYNNVDITNFSSSWNDGLAICAILHSYIPEKINFKNLTPADKRRNFELALAAAESVGISTTLDINDMITSERPNWQGVYNYVTSIYGHFET